MSCHLKGRFWCLAHNLVTSWSHFVLRHIQECTCFIIFQKCFKWQMGRVESRKDTCAACLDSQRAPSFNFDKVWHRKSGILKWNIRRGRRYPWIGPVHLAFGVKCWNVMNKLGISDFKKTNKTTQTEQISNMLLKTWLQVVKTLHSLIKYTLKYK